MHRKVIIIGSGPAAHTAAIYASRANLKPLLLEGMLAGGVAAGGQLTTTTEVENFPGFPEGITGMELTDKFREQSLRFGTDIETETVTRVDLSSKPIKVWVEENDGPEDTPYTCDALIVATGATARKLPIKGGDFYWQKGISACAVCDGAAPIFKHKVLAVVGGGDSACEEAMFLTKYATKVLMIVRKDHFRASNIMANRALSHPKIEVMWLQNVVEVLGNGKLVTGAVLRHSETNETTTIDIGGLFFAIGHTPNTSFLGGQLKVDKEGYVLATPGKSTTEIEGVFVAGDVQDKRYRQAITAAGSGCMAALDCCKYLEELES
ncbi:Thioredoxin reductase 1 [Zancudomyces culisetae]|uniref:Thioredoxin reductase n=1 Tax=Zancudomyces culisetae TaxID=1213189 RepID=A0A1R1PLX7_ZANCU|nr:Thioredoxin reductase 1 [Zancudomyces culisetae]|eukprot:OMH81981.1 Thioredoxin reductase 1 [Zancudomyces culisetae]